jgi:hypothetical protein
MTQDEVYNGLAHFVMDILPPKKWTKAELRIKKLEGVLGMSGTCYCEDGEKVSLRTKYDDDLRDKLLWLHQFTTRWGGDKNRWNRAIYTLYPEGKFDMEFIWDQELQDGLVT